MYTVEVVETRLWNGLRCRTIRDTVSFVYWQYYCYYYSVQTLISHHRNGTVYSCTCFLVLPSEKEYRLHKRCPQTERINEKHVYFNLIYFFRNKNIISFLFFIWLSFSDFFVILLCQLRSAIVCSVETCGLFNRDVVLAPVGGIEPNRL